MKILNIVTYVFAFACLKVSAIEESEIIPKFYKILMSKDAPSINDELEFFAGQECVGLKNKLLTKNAYKNSKTPIWDYLRSNKYLFITENIIDAHQFRATYSVPFDSVRAWNGNKVANKRVYVSFPKKMIDSANNIVSGHSAIIFTLGNNCYLDIAATIKCPSSNYILNNESIDKSMDER